MKTMTRRFVLALLFGGLAWATLAGQDATSTRPLRLLFIGNSYTYVNNLPEMFSKLAEAGGHRVETDMIAPGGWKLQDHWNKQEERNAVHQYGWDYVVLQDQSTLGTGAVIDGKARVTNDSVFRPYADKWAAEIKGAGARAIFYLTWARKATPEDQKLLTDAYTRAAKANGAMMAPVGIAWSLVRQKHPSIELFAADGSHPSPAGTYLAACTFYATVFDKSPAGLPAKISGTPVILETGQVGRGKTAVLADLQPADAAALQAAAWSAWRSVK